MALYLLKWLNRPLRLERVGYGMCMARIQDLSIRADAGIGSMFDGFAVRITVVL